MPIPLHTNVTAPLSPTSALDTYPTHKAIWGFGGLRTVEDDTERDAIPADRREKGMVACVYPTGGSPTYYYLAEDLLTWVPFGPIILQADDGTTHMLVLKHVGAGTNPEDYTLDWVAVTCLPSNPVVVAADDSTFHTLTLKHIGAGTNPEDYTLDWT